MLNGCVQVICVLAHVHNVYIPIQHRYRTYFFSVGYFVTSVVDKLIGRCIARRRANNGTNSTPPDIMHVRGFTYLHFFAQRFVCSHKRFAASWLSFRFIEAAIISRFSLPLFGICCVRSNFGLQSQKQLIQHCAGSLCRWSSWMSFLWFSAAIISALFGRFSESNVCIRVLSVQPIDFINDCPTWRGLRHGAPPGPHLFQTSCYSWSVHEIDQFYQTIWNYFHTQTNHIERVFCITSHSFGSTAVQFHFVLFLCSRTSFISQMIFHMLAGRIAERNIRIVTIFGDYLTGWIAEWCSATTTFCSKWCLEYEFSAILNGFEK